MKRFFIYALLFAAAFSLDSCREKSQVDELKDFIEEVKDKGSSYTEAQWEEANKTGAAIDGFVDGLKSDDKPKDK